MYLHLIFMFEIVPDTTKVLVGIEITDCIGTCTALVVTVYMIIMEINYL